MLIAYIFLFVLHILLTIWFYFSSTHNTLLNYTYNLFTTYFLIIPFIQGFFYNKLYPALRSIIIPLQISNFFYATALYIWFYFNVTGREIPFPSIADLFFLLYYPANFISLLMLGRLTKTKITFNSTINFALVFIALSTISVLFLSSESIDYSAPLLTIILNLVYPLCDSLLIATSLTILRSQSNISYRYLFFYIFGYIFVGFADVIFAYQTYFGLYWNGNLVDMIFTTSHLCIALGTYFLPNIVSNPKPTASQSI